MQHIRDFVLEKNEIVRKQRSIWGTDVSSLIDSLGVQIISKFNEMFPIGTFIVFYRSGMHTNSTFGYVLSNPEISFLANTQEFLIQFDIREISPYHLNPVISSNKIRNVYMDSSLELFHATEEDYVNYQNETFSREIERLKKLIKDTKKRISEQKKLSRVFKEHYKEQFKKNS